MDDRRMLLPTPLAQDEALRALSDIRSAIDRTTRYSTFSACSGFLAGAAALLGSGLCGLLPNWTGADPSRGIAFLEVWTAVFTVAACGLFVLTAMKARQRGEPLWTPIARTAFGALLGPALASLGASIVLVKTGRFDLLPGLWLTLYGCGLYAVSFFAPHFLRVMGLAFMALGWAAWLTPFGQAALWLGLGFGGLHLVFGMIVLRTQPAAVSKRAARSPLSDDARLPEPRTERIVR